MEDTKLPLFWNDRKKRFYLLGEWTCQYCGCKLDSINILVARNIGKYKKQAGKIWMVCDNHISKCKNEMQFYDCKEIYDAILISTIPDNWAVTHVDFKMDMVASATHNIFPVSDAEIADCIIHDNTRKSKSNEYLLEGAQVGLLPEVVRTPSDEPLTPDQLQAELLNYKNSRDAE